MGRVSEDILKVSTRQKRHRNWKSTLHFSCTAKAKLDRVNYLYQKIAAGIINPQTDKLPVLVQIEYATTKWTREGVLGLAPTLRSLKNPQNGPLGDSFKVAAEQFHSWSRKHPPNHDH